MGHSLHDEEVVAQIEQLLVGHEPANKDAAAIARTTSPLPLLASRRL
jgi:hypothetical protein